MELYFPGQIQFNFTILFICIAFVLLKYIWDMQKRIPFHIPIDNAHMFAKGSGYGPWNSLAMY